MAITSRIPGLWSGHIFSGGWFRSSGSSRTCDMIGACRSCSLGCLFFCIKCSPCCCWSCSSCLCLRSRLSSSRNCDMIGACRSCSLGCLVLGTAAPGCLSCNCSLCYWSSWSVLCCDLMVMLCWSRSREQTFGVPSRIIHILKIFTGIVSWWFTCVDAWFNGVYGFICGSVLFGSVSIATRSNQNCER